MLQATSVLIPSLILTAGVVDDLRSRKVHNELVLAALAVAAIFCIWTAGPSGLGTGLLGLAAAVIMTLPLVMFGVLGAGDLKLFMAFGMATTWEVVVYVGIAALIWGAILGVLSAAVGGRLKTLVTNTFGIVRRQPLKELTRIPYTIALLMGWISYLASVWRSA
jgi:prepilin peptidase CpaA